MTINIHRESAKIYQFPLHPRRRLENGSTVPSAAYDVMVSVVDNCWYHDEAVRDPSKPSERPKPC